MGYQNNTMYSDSVIKDLEELNSDEARIRLPIRVFIGILSVLGIIGNTHVLYIYGAKFKRSTYRTFVLTLSTIDMVGCCVSMPFEIVDEALPYLFTSSVACKLFRYVNTCVAISCAMTLVLVASERYRKICKPQERQLTELGAVYSIMAVFLATCIFSSPATYVYGLKTIQFEKYNLTGTECTWGDHMEDSVFGYIYYGMLLIVVVGCMISLTVLYVLVGVKINLHEKSTRKTLRTKQSKSVVRDSNVKSNLLMSQNQDGNRNSTRQFSSCENIADGNTPCKSWRLSTSCEILCKVNLNTSDVCNSQIENGSKQLKKHDTEHTTNPHEIVNDPGQISATMRNSYLDRSVNNTDIKDECSCPLNHISDNGEELDDKVLNGVSGSLHKAKSNDTLRISDIDKALKHLSTIQENAQLPDIDQILCQDQHSEQGYNDKSASDKKCESATLPFQGLNVKKRQSKDTVQTMRNTFTRILQLGTRGLESRRNSQDSNKFKILNLRKIFSIDDREKRITKVLFTITMLFILSFIPYIVVLIVYAIDEHFEDGMTPLHRKFYLIGLRLYNINNVANSLLYGLFDLKFRDHCFQLYKSFPSLFCKRK